MMDKRIIAVLRTKIANLDLLSLLILGPKSTEGEVNGLRSAVGNVSGNRCESDCRSRGREFDPGPVPYFCGD